MKKFGKFEALVLHEFKLPDEPPEPDDYTFIIIDTKRGGIVGNDKKNAMPFSFSTAEEAHMAVDYIAEIVNRAVDDE